MTAPPVSSIAHRALALVLASLLACAAPAQASSNAKTRPETHTASQNDQAVFYASRPEAMAFAVDLALRRNLDVEWVRQQIAQAQRLPQVARLMLPAPRGTAKNWAAYRARFIEPIRLRAGLAFWENNRDTLSRAEAELGWRPLETFDTGIRKTVQWYLQNPDWVAGVQTGAYRDWVQTQYDGEAAQSPSGQGTAA